MRVRKRFGQHFLESAWVTKLVAAIDPRPDEVFLEIGSGPGALTLALAPRVKQIVAVEIDRELAAELPAIAPANVRVVQGNFLDVDPLALMPEDALPFRVAGNLPYNVSSPILFKLLSMHGGGHVIRDATLMLQREVADRLVAGPGGAEYGVLALQTALHADVERLLVLPPGAFRPPPKVTSAVVRLRFHPPSVPLKDPALFERLVRGLFQQRRKTVLNALKPMVPPPATAGEVLAGARIDPARRPQTLTLGEMAELADVLYSFLGSR